MTKDTDLRTGRRKEGLWFGPWLSTQKAAKERGSKHYFTGVPCAKGHVSIRLASNAACMGCHRLKCNAFNKMKRQLDPNWRDEQNEKKRENYDPQKNKEWCINWRNNNKEYVKEFNRAYMQFRRAEDPTLNEMSRLQIAAKREDTQYKENELRNGRLRYAANPERFREKSRLYAKSNPEVAATHARNRRSRLRNCDGTHTHNDVLSILTRQNFKCVECGIDIRTDYEMDHIVPISRGGSNWPSNLQGLCPTCNRQKSCIDPILFAERKGRLL